MTYLRSAAKGNFNSPGRELANMIMPDSLKPRSIEMSVRGQSYSAEQARKAREKTRDARYTELRAAGRPSPLDPHG